MVAEAVAADPGSSGPLKLMLPLLGSARPAMVCSRVVFPEPLRPKMRPRVLGSTDRVTPRRSGSGAPAPIRNASGCQRGGHELQVAVYSPRNLAPCLALRDAVREMRGEWQAGHGKGTFVGTHAKSITWWLEVEAFYAEVCAFRPTGVLLRCQGRKNTVHDVGKAGLWLVGCCALRRTARSLTSPHVGRGNLRFAEVRQLLVAGTCSPSCKSIELDGFSSQPVTTNQALL